MKCYNTETRTKEEIVAAEDNHIRLYTCGPTVYNFAHIGNFRTYVFEDLLRRTLKFFGFKVTQVMNITDLEDKIIRGAIEKNVPIKTFTEPFTKAFFEDLQTLNVEKVEFNPKATDYIPQMVEMIQGLLDQGLAYKTADGSVYYSIAKFPTYGRLSHLHLEDLKPGASDRMAADEYDKEHASDFALWKVYEPSDGHIYWDTSLGRGRPGWHIECSAMAMSLLGKTIDIHVGGIDNMFPHHENEIAQSEGVTKQRFVRYWMHAEHLLVDHKKMSKSLGNFYTLRDLITKGYTGAQIRYLLLSTHYRTQLNFTFAGLDAAAKSLERVADFVDRLRHIDHMQHSGLVEPLLKKILQNFSDALADDLNISVALSALFDLIREINTLCDQEQVSKEEAHKTIHLLEKMDHVLGVLPLKAIEIPSDLQSLLAQREEARLSKNWAQADKCRDQILARGYLIEDTPSGARLKRVFLN